MTESNLFLTADGQQITLEQALQHLENAGKLEDFIWEIIRQHVIEQELKTLENVDISPEIIDQLVLDFRLENDLTDYEVFQAWLADQGLDYANFRKQIASNVELEELKAQVTKLNIQEYFIERKIFLDQVVLSRLVVEEQALAEELKSQILEDGARFEQLIQEYSVAEDKIYNGMIGAISRGTLPDVIRAAVDIAKIGELLGPLEIEGLWYLVRVEEFLEASL
ncbi:peptidylprolyl isomerase [Nostoc sp. XA010]|uniref:peptidylprolyl isomerase n=1 Tax=Nostoc sp. XA010 TaxID=2780407 RepID=UPI001E2DED5B|nr:peptidylprolyl isomerase [Nostoc sp. XA010]MCC5661911.1 peptidylprolyl isomerase [Nostoc sp. XA010]